VIKISSVANSKEITIKVSDNGSGMSPTKLEKIFTPFYTTNPVEKGSGLGLSISYGIMQRHQGTIEADSKEGEGTTFTLLLPLNPKPKKV